MTKDETLQHLRAAKAVLAQRFGVVDLALFGSAARAEAGPTSDVDILVAFDGPATSSRYFGVQFYLEDLLGRPVDLVTDKALRDELRPFIEREAIHVAGRENREWRGRMPKHRLQTSRRQGAISKIMLAYRRAVPYHLWHIRPLVVSPLTHPERVPSPWGFLMSGRPKIVAGRAR